MKTFKKAIALSLLSSCFLSLEAQAVKDLGARQKKAGNYKPGQGPRARAAPHPHATIPPDKTTSKK
ncbi:MAG: hypothetical protein ACPGUZ_00430 [Holosporaceae bacterium]